MRIWGHSKVSLAITREARLRGVMTSGASSRPRRPRISLAAGVEGCKGLQERALEPRQVVWLTVVVGREFVGSTDRGVAYVVERALYERSDVREAIRVGHRPRSADGDVHRRRVG